MSHSNDISVFAPDGRYLDTFGNLDGAPFAMTFDSQDHLWTVTNRGIVYEFPSESLDRFTLHIIVISSRFCFTFNPPPEITI